MTTEVVEIEQVYRAVHTLYVDNNGVPLSEKQAASAWLNEFQRSVKNYNVIADCLRHWLVFMI